MVKITIKDNGIIELPKNIQKKFNLEKGTEFNLFYDSQTIYLKKIFKTIDNMTFDEVAMPFREMAKQEKIKPKDIAEEIKKYRKSRSG